MAILNNGGAAAGAAAEQRASRVAPGASGAPVLSAHELRKRYGEAEVVRGVSFSIEAGECFGLLGPNGAGKTTTLRLALGLAQPDAGSITLRGFAVPQQARLARARVGVVPQMDNLDPDFTVAENLLVYGRYYGLPEREIRARIPALLEFAGLTARAGARIQALSGGMKRRLTLARALVNDPEVIFLDEPTTGLDPQARHLIWERLKTLLGQGRTILLTTHFMDEAERLCSRLAIMDAGRIIAQASPRQLIERHIEPQVVEVFGEGVRDWAREHARGLASRIEETGETVFCYAARAEPLLSSLTARSSLRYLHRPANLEDVFLKLTGRELRE
ncbi:MAG: ATP-binding cassette domain-containing protein [Burkholderiales bacterium]|nr:ATP-binding cassette domain-containing protein [Burkholderiales bacterium]